jgi:hypothetical protein
MKNAAGQKRSETAHERIRLADCPNVLRSAKNGRSPSDWQTAPTFRHVGGSELSRDVSRTQEAEFIAKCSDSLRELEETAYWLELLVDGKIVAPERLSALRKECGELIAIFVTILKRSKETS